MAAQQHEPQPHAAKKTLSLQRCRPRPSQHPLSFSSALDPLRIKPRFFVIRPIKLLDQWEVAGSQARLQASSQLHSLSDRLLAHAATPACLPACLPAVKRAAVWLAKPAVKWLLHYHHTFVIGWCTCIEAVQEGGRHEQRRAVGSTQPPPGAAGAGGPRHGAQRASMHSQARSRPSRAVRRADGSRSAAAPMRTPLCLPLAAGGWGA